MSEYLKNLMARAGARVKAEEARELEHLRGRPDRLAAYDYFLDLAATGLTPAAAAARTGRPAVNLLCLQAPLELFQAAGLSPFKVFGGSQAGASLAAQGLPALMCPMLKSVLGLSRLRQEEKTSGAAGEVGTSGSSGAIPWVLPTTCDWVVKYPEMARLAGLSGLDSPGLSGPLHWLELPHVKDREGSQARWLEEVLRLKDFLQNLTGRPITRRALAGAVAVYGRAWRALTGLILLRRAGRIAAPWFFLTTNVFFGDTVEKWTEAVEKLIPAVAKNPAAGRRVFLAGSPIFFPNFKLPRLMEEAGLTVAADDLCSSERLFPGGVDCGDPSEFGLLEALAQRYHQGCLCPTFADNDRRVNNILGQAAPAGPDVPDAPAGVGVGAFEGVVYQVLKGCHPFDLESFSVEAALKAAGLKFIRLETDYTAEDSQNLSTRLEAFRQTLGVGGI
ncbi:MAG: 2-hydroxyacyl-CoA dehydratase family protein [Candidatus Adiutrix sp.]|jgi:benzoyl-CoA reductase/2-hydroxyglutaryl-CoA dehydratase subunit BcrC/BadD/HgdB|nr:2-hydroxyacyl-CoA dehydratase family protein [Candidatus Adiutrix sp.]